MNMIYLVNSATDKIKLDSMSEEEKFEYLQKYMNKIIKQISEEIMSGNIDIHPYYKKKKTPCDYCKYKAICGFDTANSNNQYNYINEAEKNAVLEMIKEQVED